MVYIGGGVRTAIGGFGGSLSSLDAVGLGSTVIEELIKRTSVNVAEINEVIMGNVISAGQGQNPARQASVNGGIGHNVPAFTINKVCGSGLKSVVLAGQAIAAGDSSLIIAGGMEHMSSAPYLIKQGRWGQRMGHGEFTDSMINDALWDKFYDCHMGITAENIAEKHNISRKDQDEFAVDSQQKAEKAITDGRFKDEIVPVRIKQRKGEDKVFDTDEHPRFGANMAAHEKLRPAFKKDGSVTAANSSGVNDGAAAVLVMSEGKFKALQPDWVFKIVASHSCGLDPAVMGLGPIDSSRGALAKAGWSVDDLDLIEVNEAFAAQSIAVHREMKWDMDKVNVLGGGIALGHPVGVSGTRILITLMYELVKRDKSRGLASLCIGGGQGIAMAIERVR